MPRGWRTRLQLVGGFALVLLAIWVVVLDGGTGTDGRGGSGGATTSASSGGTPSSSLEPVAESQLPPEGRETLDRIRSDGPFPHDRDGITFENREGTLPSQDRGYYREYTVPTPGEDDRGARRIVGGDDGDRYYTADHYASFRQIEEGQ